MFTSWHEYQLTSLAMAAMADNPDSYNWQIVYGNVNTGEQQELVFGTQADGTPLTKGRYLRWFSMTKLTGALIAAKALEEGIIHIDDKISMYLPAFAKENMKVVNDDGTGVVNATSDITVRNLLAMRGGFGYDFGVPDAKIDYLKANYGGYYVACCAVDKNAELVTARLAQVPLLSQPGTFSQYGFDYDVLGAAISVALTNHGISMTAAEYLKNRFFMPLGMDSSWLFGGELQPPADAVTNMVDASFNNATGRYWCKKEPSGCNFPNGPLLDSVLFEDVNPALTQAGFLGGGGVGPLTDYAQLLKMVLRDGAADDGTQIVSKQTMHFLRQASYTSGKPDGDHTTNDKTVAYVDGLPVSATAPGLGGISTWSSSDWGYGTMVFDPELFNGAMPFPMTATTRGWSGYTQTKFIYDLDTGNYLVQGTQTMAGQGYCATPGLPSCQPWVVEAFRVISAVPPPTA